MSVRRELKKRKKEVGGKRIKPRREQEGLENILALSA